MAFRWPRFPATVLLAAIFAAVGFLALTSPAGAADGKLGRADGSSITYYLDARDPSKPSRILLVVLQGSDCNSVTEVKAIRQYLAKALPKADLLTVEKYGIDATLPYDADPERPDCPKPYLKHDSPAQRVDDLAAVIARLKQTRGYRQVVAIGGSEGAVVANLLAAQLKQVNAIIAFNGGGQWFLDDVLHGIAASAASDAEKAQSAQNMREFARHIRSGPASALVASNHGYAWWKEMLSLDQRAVLLKVSIPTLIIQGGRDDSVSPTAVSKMVQSLNRAGRRNIDYRRYPTLDHKLAEPDKTSGMPRVVQDMAAWLRARGFTD